jgi:hypothetical protein
MRYGIVRDKRKRVTRRTGWCRDHDLEGRGEEEGAEEEKITWGKGSDVGGKPS